MGTKYEELVPTYATTTGTLHDTGPSGGTWSNLSAASHAIPNPSAGKDYNLLGQFSAVRRAPIRSLRPCVRSPPRALCPS